MKPKGNYETAPSPPRSSPRTGKRAHSSKALHTEHWGLGKE